MLYIFSKYVVYYVFVGSHIQCLSLTCVQTCLAQAVSNQESLASVKKDIRPEALVVFQGEGIKLYFYDITVYMKSLRVTLAY